MQILAEHIQLVLTSTVLHTQSSHRPGSQRRDLWTSLLQLWPHKLAVLDKVHGGGALQCLYFHNESDKAAEILEFLAGDQCHMHADQHQQIPGQLSVRKRKSLAWKEYSRQHIFKGFLEPEYITTWGVWMLWTLLINAVPVISRTNGEVILLWGGEQGVELYLVSRRPFLL